MSFSIINQTWYHVFESYSKDKYNQKIIFVFDFISLDDYFYYDFEDIKFANLYVKNRITGGELAYLFFDTSIKISLGKDNNFPSLTMSSLKEILENSHWNDVEIDEFINYVEDDEREVKHIKLEIGYDFVDNNPILEKTIFNEKYGGIWNFLKICFYFIKDFFSRNTTKFANMRRCYESDYIIEEFIQPEFNLHIPHGLELDNSTVELIYYINDEENSKIKAYKKFTYNSITEYIYDDSSEDIETNIEYYDLDEDIPILISKNNIKNRSTLLLNSKEYNNLCTPEFIEKFSTITLTYKTKFLKKYLLIPMFAFLTLFLSLIELKETNMLTVPFVALISFVVLYLTLERENYTYPFKRITFLIIVGSILMLSVKLILFIFDIKNIWFGYKLVFFAILFIIVYKFYKRYLKIKE
ncbi:hypothetical protein [Methanobrevibacter sp. DSM 116169]|uniref:hypothetical protein n=1 Tax=Methanobrevibacter sp. DSM 116169 TaxID=3242727 RepID=UPI0038FD0D4D